MKELAKLISLFEKAVEELASIAFTTVDCVKELRETVIADVVLGKADVIRLCNHLSLSSLLSLQLTVP